MDHARGSVRARQCEKRSQTERPNRTILMCFSFFSFHYYRINAIQEQIAIKGCDTIESNVIQKIRR